MINWLLYRLQKIFFLVGFFSFFSIFGCHSFKRFGSRSEKPFIVVCWSIEHLCMQLGKPFTERYCFAILSAVSLEMKTLVTIRKLYTKCIWATRNLKLKTLLFSLWIWENQENEDHKEKIPRSGITIVLVYEGKNLFDGDRRIVIYLWFKCKWFSWVGMCLLM